MQSKLIARVQSPIIPIIGALIRQNPGTISLGQGVVSYAPPPEAFAQVGRFCEQPELNKYQAVHGIAQLIDALGKKLAVENAIDVSSESKIVVTAGGNMAFVNALLAIVEPGDEVILQVPYYFNHEMAITMASCTPVLVPTDSNSQLQPDLIERAITARTRAVVTISPNNPTGAVYPEEALRAVNGICRLRGIYHISDEAYEYFTYDGVSHFSPASLPGSAAHTISLFSFSKSFGMASWRVGYMVIPPHLFDAINKIQDTVLICPPVISQFAALGALEAGMAFCAPRLRALSETRKSVLSALSALDDCCQIPLAEGAFYFLLKLKTDTDALDLVKQLICEHRVAAIPGSAFGLTNSCQLRVSYGALDRDSVDEGVGRLIGGIKSFLEIV